MGIWGVLGIGLGWVALVAGPGLAQQQIIPDVTLGRDASRVISNGPVDLIIGGVERDTNLFHSFESFGILPQRAAVFLSESRGIANIFARVTGRERSEILGTLGTIGFLNGEVFPADVNLFLINPNGIVFGPDAQLDIGSAVRGSFFATTLNGFVWPDGSRFSGSNRQGTQALLNIAGNPSGVFAEQLSSEKISPGKIEIDSSTLSVNSGQSLTFLGGEIAAMDSLLFVASPAGGKVSLVGIAEAGVFPLQLNANLWSVNVPADLARSDIRLQDAGISAISDNGGDVTLDGKNIILDRSFVFAGLRANMPASEQVQAGDIKINATQTVLIQGTNSGIANNVGPATVGNTGDIKVSASSIEILDEATLSSHVFGTGNSGAIELLADQFILTENTVINSAIKEQGLGLGGHIKIEAPVLEIVEGSQILTTSTGRGDAGGILMIASDRILLQGQSPNRKSGVFSGVASEGEGDGGDITIETSTLEIADGAQLVTQSLSIGNSGNIKIVATDQVSIRNSSAAITQASTSATGKSGDILIETPVFEAINGSQLNAGTAGIGNAGTIEINASDRILLQNLSAIITRVESTGEGEGGDVMIDAAQLNIEGNAQIDAGTAGFGNGGDIRIAARDVVFQGDGSDRRTSSAIVSNVELSGNGDGGSILIETDRLEVLDGAQIAVATLGQGNAGTVKIRAGDRVLLRGTSRGGEFPSAVFSSVGSTALGQGGDITIQTTALSVDKGAQIVTATQGDGKAGAVTIRSAQSATFDGTNTMTGQSSGIFTTNGTPNSDIKGTGQGGDIQIDSEQLTLSNGAVFNARTTNNQVGGNISLELNALELSGGSQILTTSDGEGAAGNITVTARKNIRISGSDSGFEERLARFETAVTPISGSSTLSVRANRFGAAGNIVLDAPDFVLSDRGQIIAESTTGNGGNIFIGTKPDLPEFAHISAIAPNTILLRNNSLISATAGNSQNPGDGGNITIETPFLISLPNQNSDIIANAFEGSGGNITINANAILNFQLQDEPNVNTLRANRTNDISASSAFGSSGILNLAGLNVDPSRGTAELPTTLIDGAEQIDQSCDPRTTATNTFTRSGRGGIPLSPSEAPQSSANLPAWVALPDVEPIPLESSESVRFVESETVGGSEARLSLQEATHWHQNHQGQIQLIAAKNTAPNPVSCTARG